MTGFSLHRNTNLCGIMAGLLLVTACETMAPAQPSQSVPVAPVAAPIVDPIEVPIAAVPQPVLSSFTPADFIDKPANALDLILGPPALTRTEDQGQFRRYDTPTCRIYAVVFADAGGRPVVKSLSTGPIIAGNAAPDFAECFIAGS